MHQLRLAALILSICVSVPASSTDNPKKVTSDQLVQIVAAAQTMPDADAAQKLAGLALTDRLSGTR
jgi:hypothetical protein